MMTALPRLAATANAWTRKRLTERLRRWPSREWDEGAQAIVVPDPDLPFYLR